MTLEDLLANSGITLFAIMTLVQIAPIKINPWSAIVAWIGKALNSNVLNKLNELQDQQEETQIRLDEYILKNDERNANVIRGNILRFDNELLRGIPHTQESYIEVLTDIDQYERYCANHPLYRNNRAVCAIRHIESDYEERLKNNNFLK